MIPAIPRKFISPLTIAVFVFTTTALAGELSTQHKKELSVFGMRSMGLKVSVGDIKNVLSRAEIEQMVAAGLNLNGHLCAQVVDIRPLKMPGAYEVTCIAYRGGNAKKAYVLETLKGIAFEP